MDVVFEFFEDNHFEFLNATTTTRKQANAK